MRNAAENLSTLVAAFNSSCKRTKKSASSPLDSSESSSSSAMGEEEDQSNFIMGTPDKICLRVDPRAKAKKTAYDELLQVQSAQAALSSHDGEANNSVKRAISVLMKP